MTSARTEQRREQLTALCLALPAAEVTSKYPPHLAFEARGKRFAYYWDNHHDDGRIAIWCKSTALEQAELVASDPAQFFVPPYVGPKGWIGVRLDLEEVDWETVRSVVLDSYRRTAPKTLVALLPR